MIKSDTDKYSPRPFTENFFEFFLYFITSTYLILTVYQIFLHHICKNTKESVFFLVGASGGDSQKYLINEKVSIL